MALNDTVKQLGLVALGGAVGSALRYVVTIWLVNPKGGFSWGVFSVNMAGSFLIGLAAGHLSTKPNSTIQLLVLIGFLGGFTTFSSFSLENLNLLKQGEIIPALL